MLKLSSLVVCLGLGVVLAGPAVTAQTNGQPEEFSATAIVNNNLGAGTGRVIMRVTRWSTEAERGQLTRTCSRRALTHCSTPAGPEVRRHHSHAGQPRLRPALRAPGAWRRWRTAYRARDRSAGRILGSAQPASHDRLSVHGHPDADRPERRGHGNAVVSPRRSSARGNTIELENFASRRSCSTTSRAKVDQLNWSLSPNSSSCARARSRSICSAVAPRRSSRSSTKASATSPSPVKTVSAPARFSSGRSRRYDRAREHADAGIDLARGADHLGAVGHSRRRQDQAARRRNAGLDQRLRPRRIAVDRIDALLPDRANGIDVQLDDGRLDAALLEQSRHRLSGRAVANQHRAMRVARRARFRRRRLVIDQPRPIEIAAQPRLAPPPIARSDRSCGRAAGSRRSRRSTRRRACWSLRA